MTDRRLLRAGPLKLDLADESARLDGARVKLGNKAFLILRALMARAQTLVTKDDLIAEAWEGRAVSDAVITTAMKELRQAIGDDARAPRFIETVHGRGYRFLMPVEEGDTGAAGPFRLPHVPVPVLIGACVLLAVVATLSFAVFGGPRDDGAGVTETVSVAHPKSVAVTPVEDLSADGAGAWFAAGLTEELTSALARTPDIRVSEAATPEDAATQAAHVLEASVRSDGARLRVSARLLRAADGETLWSQTYDRGQADADLIDVQEDIAYEIARALRTVTAPGALEAMVAAGTRSVEAYEAYLQGHAFNQQRLATGDASLREAAYERYEAARALDPDFAEAHWRAAVYWFERSTFITAPDEVERHAPLEIRDALLERIDAAIDATADPVAAQKYRAVRHAARLELRAAQRELAAYVEARPRDPYALTVLVRLSASVADYAAARDAAEKLAGLVDERSEFFTRTVTAFLFARDPEAAARQARVTLDRAPENAFVQYHAHRALLWIGETEEADAVLRRIDVSALPEANKDLARLRQACAVGDAAEASRLVAVVRGLEGASVGVRWLTAEATGDDAAIRELLTPYDAPDRLAQLAAFLIYPQFDAAPFPNLSALLEGEGIERPAPLRSPFRCG